ncbi:hypothetical protein HAP94_25855 [Acidithiobacillus ferrivorans]|nr:hypothetical protein [Acidithiobacillus ferrivorans]
MAKCNTASAHEVARIINLKTGTALLIRSDRKILRRNLVSGQWLTFKKIKEGVSIEAFIAHHLNKPNAHWVPLKRGMIPSFEAISRMESNGIAEATDGCEHIEPDGTCIHGMPAWTEVALRHGFAG